MKNKKFTYVLFAVVLIVWGLIIYRVLFSIGADDEQPQFNSTIKKEPYNDFDLPKDTTHLLANYRDPFGLIKQKDTIKTVVKLTHLKSVPAIVKPAINWNFINYAGFIKNPETKRLIAMLNINGKTTMLAEGETADNVKLLKNLRDSVYISFNGKKKYIPLRSSAQ